MTGIRIDPKKQAKSYLYVLGEIKPDGSAFFHPFEIIKSTDDIRTKGMQGNFVLSLETQAGASLAKYAFEPSLASDNPGKESTLFSMYVPYNSATGRIRLLRDKKVLAERVVSAKQPVVSLLFSPGKGELVQGKQTIAWDAKQEKGDELTYSLWYSPDAGIAWLPLNVGFHKTTYQVDFEKLPGSDQALLRVMASDGVNTTESRTSKLFRVSYKAPTITLVAPKDGSAFSVDQPFLVEASAFDGSEGAILDPAAYVWASDKEGVLGNGSWRFVTLRSSGDQMISLSVKNSRGMVGTTLLHVRVVSSKHEFFIHRANKKNISANSTYIDHPLCDKNPNMILMATQNWNPEGKGGVYNNHPTGVWYDNNVGKWAIFNQDRAAMPDGAAFNVQIVSSNEPVYIHNEK